MVHSNHIFHRNKTLGFVSNHIPLIIRYIKLRKENIIITCVGRSFHTYGASHLKLLSVSPIHEDLISCIAGDNFHIYSACNNIIYAWKRGHELRATFKGHDHNIYLIFPFGPHLISIDIKNNLKVWNIKTQEIYTQLAFNDEFFKITAIIHPSTYINKILLASEQGSMQLWNISTCKLVYTFKGWDSHIMALEQSPAIDIVAVGLINGQIILHNLKFDETLMIFSQDWGAITCLSFQTDTPILMSASPLGHLVFWDLEKRKIHSQLLEAHKSSVTGAKFLSSESILVTSSPDNSLKMWIVDMNEGAARLWKLREGHSSPPTFIRFYPQDGNTLISAGGDSSLRIFSTITETLNRSMGIASYNRKKSKKKKRLEEDNLKLPPIITFDFENAREKDWDNIAVIHRNFPLVTTWSFNKCKMGEHKLKPKLAQKNDLNKIYATCVCLTKCGNFVIIGYNSGNVERFNIQSGIHRLSYGVPSAHNKVIRGVQVDNLNRTVITGGGNHIKFWHFKKTEKQLFSKMRLEESIAFFRMHHENSILVIALDDYSIILIDLDTHQIFRKFEGHSAQITDITFSPNSKWIITASMDCSIRVWDIPSANLIDYFETESPCISLTFSNTGEYLATAHVNHLGIFLWINSTLFTHVSLKALNNTEESLIKYDLSEFTQDIPKINDLTFVEETYLSIDQINEKLISLSLLATSRWQHLLNFDIIRKRNKPKQALIKSTEAPFFLPTLPSLELKFDLSQPELLNNTSEKAKNININNMTVFGKMLTKSKSDKNFTILIEKLKNFGPSSLDFEINSLSPENGGSIDLLLQFMHLLDFMLISNQNFELGQSYFALFIKIHTNLLIQEKILLDFLDKLNTSQLLGWERLQKTLLYNSSVIQTIRMF